MVIPGFLSIFGRGSVIGERTRPSLESASSTASSLDENRVLEVLWIIFHVLNDSGSDLGAIFLVAIYLIGQGIE